MTTNDSANAAPSATSAPAATQVPGARSAGNWLIMLGLGVVAGLVYSQMFNPEHPFVSAFFGMSIGGPILAYERRLLFPALKRYLTASSTPTFVAGSIAVYLVLIVVGNTFAAISQWLIGNIPGDHLFEVLCIPAYEFVYSFAVAGAINFLMRIRDLLGPDVFLSFLIGRYRKPLVEERIFLFIDLIGSTALAERHGDIAAQEYLGRFFELIAEPVCSHRGLVHDYIGDMVFITWRLEEGLKDARAIRCVLDIAALTDAVTDGFGLGPDERPRFRAALHCGPVVTAEVGVYKHKIAYFGDAVNTTGRIEELAKLQDADFLASRDVLEKIVLPPGVSITPLGAQAVHGRAKPVSVAKVNWRPSDASHQAARTPALAKA